MSQALHSCIPDPMVANDACVPESWRLRKDEGYREYLGGAPHTRPCSNFINHLFEAEPIRGCE